MSTSASPEFINQQPQSELLQYDDGFVAETFKEGVVDFLRLVDDLKTDPTASEVGCIYVQTQNPDGSRHKLFVDTEVAVDPEAGKAVDMRSYPWDDPRFSQNGSKIIIGKRWNSPLGPTEGKVTAVCRPFTRGVIESMVKPAPAGHVSPAEIGRQVIETRVRKPTNK